VANVRADASPNEVLAFSTMHQRANVGQLEPDEDHTRLAFLLALRHLLFEGDCVRGDAAGGRGGDYPPGHHQLSCEPEL
jgi:hypothetical protein